MLPAMLQCEETEECVLVCRDCGVFKAFQFPTSSKRHKVSQTPRSDGEESSSGYVTPKSKSKSTSQEVERPPGYGTPKSSPSKQDSSTTTVTPSSSDKTIWPPCACSPEEADEEMVYTKSGETKGLPYWKCLRCRHIRRYVFEKQEGKYPGYNGLIEMPSHNRKAHAKTLKMTSAELRSLCATLGLHNKGDKADLLLRLEKYYRCI